MTGDIGYRLSWIYALEKRVTYGTKTTMDQFADEQAICDVGALPYICDVAQAVSCQRLAMGQHGVGARKQEGIRSAK